MPAFHHAVQNTRSQNRFHVTLFALETPPVTSRATPSLAVVGPVRPGIVSVSACAVRASLPSRRGIGTASYPGRWKWWRKREGNASLPLALPPPFSRATPPLFCHPVREVAATRTFGSTLGASQPARRPSSRPAPRVCLSPAWLGLLGPSTWSYLSPPFLRCSFFKGPCDSKATSLPSFVSWRADLLLKRAILYPLT